MKSSLILSLFMLSLVGVAARQIVSPRTELVVSVNQITDLSNKAKSGDQFQCLVRYGDKTVFQCTMTGDSLVATRSHAGTKFGNSVIVEKSGRIILLVTKLGEKEDTEELVDVLILRSGKEVSPEFADVKLWKTIKSSWTSAFD